MGQAPREYYTYITLYSRIIYLSRQRLENLDLANRLGAAGASETAVQSVFLANLGASNIDAVRGESHVDGALCVATLGGDAFLVSRALGVSRGYCAGLVHAPDLCVTIGSPRQTNGRAHDISAIGSCVLG